MAVYGLKNLSGESMEEQSLISCVMASKVNYESVYGDCINLDEHSECMQWVEASGNDGANMPRVHC